MTHRWVSRRALLTTAAAGAASGALLLGQRSAGPPEPATALAADDSAAGRAHLPVSLHNNSGSDTVYAYISGADFGGWPGFVTADGEFHRLENPSAANTPVKDYAIRLNASGGAPTTVTLSSYVISGRVWFSIGEKIKFFAVPGSPVPALVQPGLTSGDPNWKTNWTFCEFTYNSTNLYANISYVDMVSFPVSMRSTGKSGTQTVAALPDGALDAIGSGLRYQHDADGAPWDGLVVTGGDGKTLRVLSPMHSPTGFDPYWDPYVNDVWHHHARTPLTVDTQSHGTFTGKVTGDVLAFDGLDDDGVPFTRPNALDIFACNSGPLYNSGADARGAVASRLAAALNRSTLLAGGGDRQPDGVQPPQYYRGAVTNHYARLVHQHAKVGYAFPYDDVGPTGSKPVDGHLQDFAPLSWSITVGGASGDGGDGGDGGKPDGGGDGGNGGKPDDAGKGKGGGAALNAYATIRAVTSSSQQGTRSEACSDAGGGRNVCGISSGDWLHYRRVDFGPASPKQFVARLASGAPNGVSGAVEVRLDSATGPCVAVLDIAGTGGWQSWKTVPMNISGDARGVHDVYLTFASGSGRDFVNVNWFRFSHS